MSCLRLMKTLVIFTLMKASFQTTTVELLKLKSHWVGMGVSVMYPGQLKLLSNKLEKQAGIMTSYNTFPAGDFWELKGKLEMKCRRVNEVDPSENDFGIGLFLTKNNPRSSVSEYSYQSSFGLFGMAPAVEGLSVIFNRNNLYTGLFKTNEGSREEFLNRSKVCKAYLLKSGELHFSVKYRTNVLGVYIGEDKEQFEHLCYQFTDMTDFNEFFLTFSASDKNSGCSAQVNDLKIETAFNDYQFVENDQKKAEEFTFSYIQETENTKKRMEFNHFHKVYDFYRDNAKIFAQSLLTFADFNEKEVVHEMKEQVQKTEKTIDDAISIIELEARQIEALNSLLGSERRTITNDVNETLEQILKWMATMDGMFDKVDSETQAIHNMISDLNFDEKLEALVTKVQRVGDNLNKAIATTKAMIKPSNMDNLDINEILDWKTSIDSFQEKVNTKITKHAETKMNQLTQYFVYLLSAIAFSIVVAFLVIYFKIQKAIRNKRML